MDGGKKAMMKLMPNVYTVQICCLKTTTMKNKHDAKNVLSGQAQCMCELSEKGSLCVTGVRNDGHFLCWPLNIINTLSGNINKYNFPFLTSENCFLALSVKKP